MHEVIARSVQVHGNRSVLLEGAHYLLVCGISLIGPRGQQTQGTITFDLDLCLARIVLTSAILNHLMKIV